MVHVWEGLERHIVNRHHRRNARMEQTHRHLVAQSVKDLNPVLLHLVHQSVRSPRTTPHHTLWCHRVAVLLPHVRLRRSVQPHLGRVEPILIVGKLCRQDVNRCPAVVPQPREVVVQTLGVEAYLHFR